jgi:hypothetical protein
MHRDLIIYFSLLAAMALGMLVMHGWHTRRRREVKAWPDDFSLIARPVFNTEERLLYRELKNALPQHVVLAKINLLRFCQSASEHQARLWFDRLHPINVSFAICTPNGSVVSVIDIDAPQRASSPRGQKLKEAVLEACRVRYLRCPAGQWPKPALLAQWALGGHIGLDHAAPQGTSRPGQAAASSSPLNVARAELAQKLNERRAARASRFQDSAFASDSFFVTDSRFDLAANSSPAPLDTAPGRIMLESEMMAAR